MLDPGPEVTILLNQHYDRVYQTSVMKVRLCAFFDHQSKNAEWQFVMLAEALQTKASASTEEAPALENISRVMVSHLSCYWGWARFNSISNK